MQNITLICLGKLNAKYFNDGCKEYIKRLEKFAKLKIIELEEEQINEKNYSSVLVQKALDKEAEKILQNIPKQSNIIALCIEGKQLASEELADYFSQKAISGNGHITFIIGSSHGLSEKIKSKANLKFSMSKMTFPHQLARLMLLEQIYRGFSIISNTKYHK